MPEPASPVIRRTRPVRNPVKSATLSARTVEKTLRLARPVARKTMPVRAAEKKTPASVRNVEKEKVSVPVRSVRKKMIKIPA